MGCSETDRSGSRKCCDLNVNSDDEWLCRECAKHIKTVTCYECGNTFCEIHGQTKRYECCGYYLCGSRVVRGEEQEDEDDEKEGNNNEQDNNGCVSRHQRNEERNECGHYGCNMFDVADSNNGCHTCDEKQNSIHDTALVRRLVGQARSPDLRQHIRDWLSSINEDTNGNEEQDDDHDTVLVKNLLIHAQSEPLRRHLHDWLKVHYDAPAGGDSGNDGGNDGGEGGGKGESGSGDGNDNKNDDDPDDSNRKPPAKKCKSSEVGKISSPKTSVKGTNAAGKKKTQLPGEKSAAVSDKKKAASSLPSEKASKRAKTST